MKRRTFLAAMTAASRLCAAAPRVRAGCQTRLYGVPIKERDKLLAVLDDLRDLHYAGFETNFASLEQSFNDAAPMRAEFEKRRVPLIGLHFSVRLTDPAQLDKEFAQIERVAKASKGFGGTHIMVSGSAGTAADARERRAANLNKAGRLCCEIGIRLTVHNHVHEVENNGDEFAMLMAETRPEDVWMLLDIGHAHLAKLDVPAFVRKHGHRIAGFHVRDCRGKQEVPMGTGEVDLRGFAKVLAETKWSGWVILEMNRMKEHSSRELAAVAREYMRKEMKI